ncbi:MAG: N-acetylmuramoyl-L-alanine amidase [Prosthecobacter sp.]|uniref:N-acetylmuramoyl-L-alanine amidase n=1 Tax=Prosthecobacter sp. TaxID=1965333 RepID=UPI0025DB2DB2|nr:N-acetylmuramoyl-L-alanine amidase [Prosthecobacter sp.]MCF7786919.1 N-acetylmuramoyl-L-alanine amidase [Prosthecobacter sp.]
MLILDCCREVPDQRWLASENRTRGLRGSEAPALAPPPYILIGFATSSGRLTNDSLRETDANGPLVVALQKHWNDGLEFDSLWKAVARDVFTASRSTEQGRAELQMPSKYGQTIHDFYFVTTRASIAPIQPAEEQAKMSAKTEVPAATISDADGKPKPAAAVKPPAANGIWEIVKIDERDYVSAESIRNFYATVYDFTTFRLREGQFWLGSAKLILKAEIGSHEIHINNIKLHLCFPMAELSGRVFFSRLDLTKVIDPVLYPSHIHNAEYFDTVVIDPGHGGSDAGARGAHGDEKDLALAMALSLQKALIQREFKVVLTRTTDTFVSQEDRGGTANATAKSIFISLQFNSGATEASGIETLALTPQSASATMSRDGSYNSNGFRGNRQDSANISLAVAVHASVISRFKFIDLGIKRGEMTILRDCVHPSVLFRGGFVTYKAEGELVASDTYRQQVSAAIGDAVLNYRKALESAMAKK